MLASDSSQPAVTGSDDEDRGQPRRHREEAERLQPHVRRDLPRQRLTPQPAGARHTDRCRFLGAPRLRQPAHQREEGEQPPRRERAAPVQPGGLRHRHRDPGGERPTRGDRHRVQPGHHAGAVREVPLDQPRQQDVADGDRRAGHHGAGEERDQRIHRPDGEPGAQHHQRQQQGALDPEPAGQPRRRRCEEPEAQHRKRGQHASRRGGEALARLDLRQQRRDADNSRAQVRRDQHDRHREPPPGPQPVRSHPAHRSCSTMARAASR
jgi:hypothetical protein